VPLVSGRELMKQLQLPQGPDVGRLLAILEEAQAAGEITTAEEALTLAKQSR
jgi:2-C-methyl-D-erythritol 4-phosphate cytidylyltransferase